MSGFAGWLLRRLAFAALTLVVVAIATFAIPRILRSELYDGGPLVRGTLDDLDRAFLHFDWGQACGWNGPTSCPEVREFFAQGFAADLWLIAGALVFGIGGGLLGAMWCARRPRTRRARSVEALASLLYVAPVYVVGYGLLMLFNPTFGVFRVGAFFNATPEWEQPWTSPWTWFETLLVPWIVLAAPLAAMCLRLGLAVMRDEQYADHVRTAWAKGVSPRRVMSRHVAPTAYGATASLVGVSIPFIVINLILVERVFAVPGFFTNTYKATGRELTLRGDPLISIPMLQAISLWAAVLIVLIGIAVDLFLVRLDPHIRDGGLPG